MGSRWVKIRGSGTGAIHGLSSGEGLWTETLEQHCGIFNSLNHLGAGEAQVASGQVCFDSVEGITSSGRAGQLGTSVERNHRMSPGHLWVVHRVNACVK